VSFIIVHNGIKFKAPDRQPRNIIKTELVDNYLVFSIADNGGIEENKHDKIFSKYFRVENHIEGSGIGLYLMK